MTLYVFSSIISVLSFRNLANLKDILIETNEKQQQRFQQLEKSLQKMDQRLNCLEQTLSAKVEEKVKVPKELSVCYTYSNFTNILKKS